MSTEAPQNKLREAREAAGMTQAELAMRVGKTKQAISQYESETIRPTLDVAKALAVALNTTIDALFFGLESSSMVDDDSAALAGSVGGRGANQAAERTEDVGKPTGAAA